MNPARRRWLAGLCLTPLASHCIARAASTSPTATDLRIARRWPLDDAPLVPPAEVDGQILHAGARLIGLLDPVAGVPRWAVPHRLDQGAAFRPRAADGIVVCGGRREIGAWQLADGASLWHRTAHRQFGAFCLHRGHVYVGDGHELLAIGLASGEVSWRFAAVPDTQIAYAPAASDDTLFVGPGDGRLYALSARDGRLRWQVERMSDWQYLRQLHVADGILVAGSYKEKLYGLELATGRERWKFAAGNFINSHHVANGIAYLWSPTGWLHAIDIQTGAHRWRHRTSDYGGDRRNWNPVLAELVVRDGHLYALDLGHVLHVLAADSGAELGRHGLPEAVRPFVLPLATDQLIFGTAGGTLLLAAMALPIS